MAITNKITEVDCKEYLKENRDTIIETFASVQNYPTSQSPFTLIMAGSPGAGKTEFSIALIEELYKKNPESKIVRIDVDAIKEIFPQYNKKNSYLVQSTAILAMEKIIDHTYKHRQNILIDGTFSHYESSIKNVQRSVKDKRKIEIWCLHMDPRKAWDFTRKREAEEGRPIKKEDFIYAFFNARENVVRAKKEFGNQIVLNLVIKDIENIKNNKLHLNIDNIDSHLTIGYNRGELEKLLL